MASLPDFSSSQYAPSVQRFARSLCALVTWEYSVADSFSTDSLDSDDVSLLTFAGDYERTLAAREQADSTMRLPQEGGDTVDMSDSDTVTDVLGVSISERAFHRLLSYATTLGEGNFHRVVRPDFGSLSDALRPASASDEDIVISLAIDARRAQENGEQLTRFIDKRVPAYLMAGIQSPHLTQHLRAVVSRHIDPGAVFVVDQYAGQDLFEAGLVDDLFRPSHILQLGKALHSLHQHNLIHRDIKPENIMLSAGGGDGHIQLGDFGFLTSLNKDARRQALTLLAHNEDFRHLCEINGYKKARVLKHAKRNLDPYHQCGTPNYASPRIAEGYAYRKSDDIYSLACTLLTMTTQHPPHFSNLAGPKPGHCDSHRVQKFCTGYHLHRQRLLAQGKVSCENGLYLSKAFTRVLMDMINNVDRPVQARQEDVNVYLTQLTKIIENNDIYEKEKPLLFGCIPFCV